MYIFLITTWTVVKTKKTMFHLYRNKNTFQTTDISSFLGQYHA